MIIQGNIHTDQRGRIRFVNDFDFKGVKRFYAITHRDINVIRAWQGHKEETKYFYVTKGGFLVKWLKVDNWEQPGKKLDIQSKTLTDKRSEILIVPPGCANGFKALESGSTVVVFSDKTLQESKEDDFRYPSDYWDF